MNKKIISLATLCALSGSMVYAAPDVLGAISAWTAPIFTTPFKQVGTAIAPYGTKLACQLLLLGLFSAAKQSVSQAGKDAPGEESPALKAISNIFTLGVGLANFNGTWNPKGGITDQKKIDWFTGNMIAIGSIISSLNSLFNGQGPNPSLTDARSVIDAPACGGGCPGH